MTSSDVKPGAHPTQWRGEDHLVRVESAVEVGLSRGTAEVDSFVAGFSGAMTLDDGYDGAIVVRGRTPLRVHELFRELRPALGYLGVPAGAMQVRVHDGSFELRVTRRAAEASKPVLEAARFALQIWIGFGLLGLAAYHVIVPWLASVVWGIGLLGGGWQLRRGLASGRAMLSARLALALGILAAEGALILPPVGPDADGGSHP